MRESQKDYVRALRAFSHCAQVRSLYNIYDTILLEALGLRILIVLGMYFRVADSEKSMFLVCAIAA